MMCHHCAATVKKCLNEFKEVDSALVNHENGTAILTLNTETSDVTLKNAIEEKEYKVLD